MADEAPVIFGQYPELYRVRMSRALYNRILRMAEASAKTFHEQLVVLLEEAEIIKKD